MRAQTFSHLTIRQSLIVFVASLGLSVCEAIVVISMSFQPGWTHGWPRGISFNVVLGWFLAVGMCGVVMTSSVGVIAVVSAICERRIRMPYVGWGVLILVSSIECVILGIVARFLARALSE